jgi:hypothetical protein
MASEDVGRHDDGRATAREHVSARTTGRKQDGEREARRRAASATVHGRWIATDNDDKAQDGEQPAVRTTDGEDGVDGDYEGAGQGSSEGERFLVLSLPFCLLSLYLLYSMMY